MGNTQLTLLNELKELSKNQISPLSKQTIQALMKNLGTTDPNILLCALLRISMKYIEQLDGATEYASLAVKHWDKMDSQELELRDLRLKNASLKRTLDVANKTVAELRKQTSQPQTSKVKCGERIAYRDNITPNDIYEKLSQGLTVTQIANSLEVSRNLVYSRIAELEEAGVDIEDLKRKAKVRKNDDKYRTEETSQSQSGSLFDTFFNEGKLTPEMLNKRMNI